MAIYTKQKQKITEVVNMQIEKRRCKCNGEINNHAILLNGDLKLHVCTECSSVSLIERVR
jgi:hypothetical protein